MNNQNSIYADQPFEKIQRDAETDVPKPEKGSSAEASGAGSDSKGKRGKAKKWLLGLLIAFLLAVILILVLHQIGVFKFPWEKTASPGLAAPIIAGDLFPGVGDAQSGTLSGMTKEEILEQMQKAADANYFSFKINTKVVFADGGSEGKLGIENPSYNVYPMVVRIYLGEDGAGELIYDSGGILPDQHIDYGKLAANLPEGAYKALAYLYAYDPDTQVNIFKSSASMDIIINS